MSPHWFKRWGWVYRPIHPLGFVVMLAAIAFGVSVFLAVDRHSHSVSDTFYGIYPFLAPTFLGVMWIAGRTAGGEGGHHVN